jgi:hypothetical protein
MPKEILMAEPGRPRVLDDGKLREIAALVSAGYSLAGAAEYVGCSIHTIRREIKRNKEFADKIRKNKLYAELDPLNSIRSFGKTNWRAAAWYLERTHPDRYLKKNPALLKPVDLMEFLEQMTNIILKEVTDEATRERIAQKLLAQSEPITRSIMDFYLEGRPARPVRLRG